jgi:hypothetical protein
MEAGGGISGNQSNKRRRLNERAWRDLFKRFDGAGLTVEAFCKAEGLSRSSFNRWRSRLPVRPGAAAAVGASDARQSWPSFVDLGLLGAADAAAPAGLELRLDLGGGLSLSLVRR